MYSFIYRATTLNIFIAVGTMVGLLWNVLMSKTITSVRQVWVYKGGSSMGG